MTTGGGGGPPTPTAAGGAGGGGNRPHARRVGGPDERSIPSTPSSRSWTELKGHTVAAFDGARVSSTRAGDVALVALEPRLYAKRRAGTALAGETMAHRYSCRLAAAGDTHIAAAAGRYSLAHRSESPASQCCGLPRKYARAVIPPQAKPAPARACWRECPEEVM